jgi:hypothetical protein
VLFDAITALERELNKPAEYGEVLQLEIADGSMAGALTAM